MVESNQNSGEDSAHIRMMLGHCTQNSSAIRNQLAQPLLQPSTYHQRSQEQESLMSDITGSHQRAVNSHGQLTSNAYFRQRLQQEKINNPSMVDTHDGRGFSRSFGNGKLPPPPPYSMNRSTSSVGDACFPYPSNVMHIPPLLNKPPCRSPISMETIIQKGDNTRVNQHTAYKNPQNMYHVANPFEDNSTHCGGSSEVSYTRLNQSGISNQTRVANQHVPKDIPHGWSAYYNSTHRSQVNMGLAIPQYTSPRMTHNMCFQSSSSAGSVMSSDLSSKQDSLLGHWYKPPSEEEDIKSVCTLPEENPQFIHRPNKLCDKEKQIQSTRLEGEINRIMNVCNPSCISPLAHVTAEGREGCEVTSPILDASLMPDVVKSVCNLPTSNAVSESTALNVTQKDIKSKNCLDIAPKEHSDHCATSETCLQISYNQHQQLDSAKPREQDTFGRNQQELTSGENIGQMASHKPTENLNSNNYELHVSNTQHEKLNSRKDHNHGASMEHALNEDITPREQQGQISLTCSQLPSNEPHNTTAVDKSQDCVGQHNVEKILSNHQKSNNNIQCEQSDCIQTQHVADKDGFSMQEGHPTVSNKVDSLDKDAEEGLPCLILNTFSLAEKSPCAFDESFQCPMEIDQPIQIYPSDVKKKKTRGRPKGLPSSKPLPRNQIVTPLKIKFKNQKAHNNENLSTSPEFEIIRNKKSVPSAYEKKDRTNKSVHEKEKSKKVQRVQPFQCSQQVNTSTVQRNLLSMPFFPITVSPKTVNTGEVLASQSTKNGKYRSQLTKKHGSSKLVRSDLTSPHNKSVPSASSYRSNESKKNTNRIQKREGVSSSEKSVSESKELFPTENAENMISSECSEGKLRTPQKIKGDLKEVVSKIKSSRKRRRSAVMLTPSKEPVEESNTPDILFRTSVPDNFLFSKRQKMNKSEADTNISPIQNEKNKKKKEDNPPLGLSLKQTAKETSVGKMSNSSLKRGDINEIQKNSCLSKKSELVANKLEEVPCVKDIARQDKETGKRIYSQQLAASSSSRNEEHNVSKESTNDKSVDSVSTQNINKRIRLEKELVIRLEDCLKAFNSPSPKRKDDEHKGSEECLTALDAMRVKLNASEIGNPKETLDIKKAKSQALVRYISGESPMDTGIKKHRMQNAIKTSALNSKRRTNTKQKKQVTNSLTEKKHQNGIDKCTTEGCNDISEHKNKEKRKHKTAIERCDQVDKNHTKSMNNSGHEDFDVNQVSQAMFFLSFHGSKLLCLNTSYGKFFIMRELLQNCFKEQVGSRKHKHSQVYTAKERDLNIPFKEVPSDKRQYVTTYMAINSTLKHIGMIHVNDAKRLYHFFNGVKSCGNTTCIKEWMPDKLMWTCDKLDELDKSLNRNSSDSASETKQNGKEKGKKTSKPKLRDIKDMEAEIKAIAEYVQDMVKSPTSPATKSCASDGNIRNGDEEIQTCNEAKGSNRSVDKHGKRQKKSILLMDITHRSEERANFDSMNSTNCTTNSSLCEKNSKGNGETKTLSETPIEFSSKLCEKSCIMNSEDNDHSNHESLLKVKSNQVYQRSSSTDQQELNELDSSPRSTNMSPLLLRLSDEDEYHSDDSDITIPYMDHTEMDIDHHSDDMNQPIIKGGVAELFRGNFRFLVVNGVKYFVLEDLCLRFHRYVLFKCLKEKKETKLKAIRCLESEANFLNRLEPMLPLVLQNDTLIEEQIVYFAVKFDISPKSDRSNDKVNNNEDSSKKCPVQELSEKVMGVPCGSMSMLDVFDDEDLPTAVNPRSSNVALHTDTVDENNVSDKVSLLENVCSNIESMDGPSSNTVNESIDGHSSNTFNESMDGHSSNTFNESMDGHSSVTVNESIDGHSRNTFNESMDGHSSNTFNESMDGHGSVTNNGTMDGPSSVTVNESMDGHSSNTNDASMDDHGTNTVNEIMGGHSGNTVNESTNGHSSITNNETMDGRSRNTVNESMDGHGRKTVNETMDGRSRNTVNESIDGHGRNTVNESMDGHSSKIEAASRKDAQEAEASKREVAPIISVTSTEPNPLSTPFYHSILDVQKTVCDNQDAMKEVIMNLWKENMSLKCMIVKKEEALKKVNKGTKEFEDSCQHYEDMIDVITDEMKKRTELKGNSSKNKE